MLNAYVQRFDVTGNFEKFYKILETKQPLDSEIRQIPQPSQETDKNGSPLAAK
jgi:hypothetical protein